MPERPTGDDAFDRIVERLDMNLSFPTEPASRPQSYAEPPDLDDIPDEAEDQFYRQVPPASEVLPRGRRAVLAWAAVLGAPLVLVVCTVFGMVVSRAAVLAMCLVFVAAAIWLFSHLPERGPSQPDWPDDGAAL
jgi:hypothetical protein